MHKKQTRKLYESIETLQNLKYESFEVFFFPTVNCIPRPPLFKGMIRNKNYSLEKVLLNLLLKYLADCWLPRLVNIK